MRASSCSALSFDEKRLVSLLILPYFLAHFLPVGIFYKFKTVSCVAFHNQGVIVCLIVLPLCLKFAT
jgi:hypothetical protein